MILPGQRYEAYQSEVKESFYNFALLVFNTADHHIQPHLKQPSAMTELDRKICSARHSCVNKDEHTDVSPKSMKMHANDGKTRTA
jgi:hypothetical protein